MTLKRKWYDGLGYSYDGVARGRRLEQKRASEQKRKGKK